MHLQISLCSPVSQYLSLVTAKVTRPVGFTTTVLPCLSPSVQKPVHFIHSALYEGQEMSKQGLAASPFLSIYQSSVSFWTFQFG